MAMKKYFAFPKAPVLLEPLHQFNVISSTLVGEGGVLPTWQLVFWNYMMVYKLFVFDRNTWKYVCKLIIITIK